MRAPSCTHRDDGFSLTELLVVVALLGIILSIVYMMLGTSSSMTAANDAFSAQAQGLSDSPELVSMIVMQHNNLSNPTSNSLEVWTDRDLDGDPEKHSFRAESANRLVWEQWEYSKTNSTQVLSYNKWVMSEKNKNISAGVPLFRYYNKAGTQITAMDAVASDAYSAKLTVVVDLGGGRTATDTRDISFRNKS